MSSIYDPVECDLEAFCETYVLCPELWEKFNLDNLSIDFSKWDYVQMMDDRGNLNVDVDNIPDSVGGIYVYAIVPPVIPICGSYIMYVGKASKTEHENLRSRVKSYKYCFSDAKKRPRLYRLFKKWGKYVQVCYLPVNSTNEEITELEDRLIATFGLPPCNSDIQVESVKVAVKAFR